MKRVCVFLGASIPQNPKYLEATLALGKFFAERNVQLIYGGASTGLMGKLADTVLSNGGKVVGVMATVLKGEIIHDKLTHLHTTNSLQERKTLMANLAEGFIALPGGLGTFEEMYEIWNARKIGVCNKPLGLLNIDGYFEEKSIDPNEYKTRALAIIDEAKPILKEHRGCKRILTNLAALISTLGIVFIFNKCVNNRFLFFPETKSSEQLTKLEHWIFKLDF